MGKGMGKVRGERDGEGKGRRLTKLPYVPSTRR